MEKATESIRGRDHFAKLTEIIFYCKNYIPMERLLFLPPIAMSHYVSVYVYIHTHIVYS